MPRLLERVAPLAGGGSITGIYTVLVEGDDLADPVADSARSLLDGHIVLSRELGARGHFPAVDVLASASRVARQVTTPQVQALAQRARAALATRREIEELKNLGAYTPGTNPAHDDVLATGHRLDGWSRQRQDERSGAADASAALASVLEPRKKGDPS
jgi:flagellum-specific ATP synthase